MEKFEIGRTYLYIPKYDENNKLVSEERKELGLVSPEEFVSWTKKNCPSLIVNEDSVRTLSKKLSYFNKAMEILTSFKLSIPGTNPTDLT